MYILGKYYYRKEDYDKMKKYYLMAIAFNDVMTMYELAIYYHDIENNDLEMEKYYLMAIDYGCNDTAYLEDYYYNKNKYNELLKLYLKIQNSNKMIDLLIYIVGQKNNMILDTQTIKILYTTILPENVPLYLHIIKKLLSKKINLIESHFKYSLNSAGYEEAKKEFYSFL